MAAIQCPDCGKWVPYYSDKCWECGYEFNSCSCSCDDNDYYHDNNHYESGAKQCYCGKWVPGYSKKCWTCGHWF